MNDAVTDLSACICDDPLREGECPVHPNEEAINYPEPPTPAIITVTAADRVEPTKKSIWAMYLFKCNGCGENSIVHWGDNGFKYCPNCGGKLQFDWE